MQRLVSILMLISVTVGYVAFAARDGSAASLLENPDATPATGSLFPSSMVWSPGNELDEGRAMQTIGDYEKAISHYQSASQSADPEERARASFLLAQTYLQAEMLSEAIEAFAAFIKDWPAHPLHSQAVFLAGRAYHYSERWSEAIARYQEYLGIDSTIASFVYELMGDAYAAADNSDQAIEAYRRGLAGPIDQPMRFHLLEGIAELQKKAGSYAAAAKSYDEILAEPTSGRYRAKIAYLAGQSLAAGGQTKESYARYRLAVAADEKTNDAYLSLIELVNGGQVVDEFQRGLIDYYNGAYHPAVQAFERYIESAPTGYSGEAHYYAGLSYQESQNYTQALQKYEYIITHFGKSEKGGAAWIAKGKAKLQQGKAQEALKVWADFIEVEPEHALAPDALWETAAYYDVEGDYHQAGASYAAIADRYPNSDRAPAALHLAGLCRVRAGETDEALTAWEKLASGYPQSPVRPAALYWLGKLYHGRGNPEKGDEAHRLLVAGYPDNYYSVRAAEFQATKSGKLFCRSDQKALLFSQPQDTERAEAELWLLSWAPEKPAEGEAVSQLPERIAIDGRLQRGLLLWQVGLFADASAQIRGLKSDLQNNPLDLYRMAVFLHDQNLPRLSISCLERMLSLAPADKKANLPVYLQKLTHPLHYSDLIVAQSVERNVDPLLVLAMVRQESVFDWQAESWVGAQGLMQIMPTTGDYIAQKTGDKEYTRSRLARPYLNVRFGTWYLAQQLSAFDGDVVAALVAYNAGPGRVARWQTAEMKADDDLFLEFMPLSEPRTYVERILDHYAAYRKLYGSQ